MDRDEIASKLILVGTRMMSARVLGMILDNDGDLPTPDDVVDLMDKMEYH